MENKSLFLSIVLAVAIVVVYLFYNNKTSKLKDEIDKLNSSKKDTGTILVDYNEKYQPEKAIKELEEYVALINNQRLENETKNTDESTKDGGKSETSDVKISNAKITKDAAIKLASNIRKLNNYIKETKAHIVQLKNDNARLKKYITNKDDDSAILSTDTADNNNIDSIEDIVKSTSNKQDSSIKELEKHVEKLIKENQGQEQNTKSAKGAAAKLANDIRKLNDYVTKTKAYVAKLENNSARLKKYIKDKETADQAYIKSIQDTSEDGTIKQDSSIKELEKHVEKLIKENQGQEQNTKSAKGAAAKLANDIRKLNDYVTKTKAYVAKLENNSARLKKYIKDKETADQAYIKSIQDTSEDGTIKQDSSIKELEKHVEKLIKENQGQEQNTKSAKGAAAKLANDIRKLNDYVTKTKAYVAKLENNSARLKKYIKDKETADQAYIKSIQDTSEDGTIKQDSSIKELEKHVEKLIKENQGQEQNTKSAKGTAAKLANDIRKLNDYVTKTKAYVAKLENNSARLKKYIKDKETADQAYIKSIQDTSEDGTIKQDSSIKELEKHVEKLIKENQGQEQNTKSAKGTAAKLANDIRKLNDYVTKTKAYVAKLENNSARLKKYIKDKETADQAYIKSIQDTSEDGTIKQDSSIKELEKHVEKLIKENQGQEQNTKSAKGATAKLANDIRKLNDYVTKTKAYVAKLENNSARLKKYIRKIKDDNVIYIKETVTDKKDIKTIPDIADYRGIEKLEEYIQKLIKENQGQEQNTKSAKSAAAKLANDIRKLNDYVAKTKTYIDQLENNNTRLKKYIKRDKNETDNNSNYIAELTNELIGLNNQLIQVRSNFKDTQKKLLLAKNMPTIATSKIVRAKTKAKKAQLEKKQVTKLLAKTEDQLESLKSVFINKNKSLLSRSIDRIDTLKDDSGDIMITGATIPIVGAIALVAYTLKEIEHHCKNIESITALEENIFGESISLTAEMKANYQKKCSQFNNKSLEL